MYEDGFVRKPNSLLSHTLWQEASGMERRVLERLLELAVYTESKTVNGVLLKKGQVMFTIRQIAIEEKFEKHIVEGAINHFLGLTRRGKPRCDAGAPLIRQESRQENRLQSRQEKSFYSILLDGYFIEEQTRKQTKKQTEDQTQSRQEADKVSSAYMYKDSEDGKTFARSKDLSKMIIRHGGNVDNSQASYQHSPHAPDSSFSNLEKQTASPGSSSSSSEESSDSSCAIDKRSLQFFSRATKFRFKDGSSIKEESLRVWLIKLTPVELMDVFDWFETMQKRKGDDEILLESYMQEGITQGWWKVWKKREEVKKIEEKQKRLLRANGSI